MIGITLLLIVVGNVILYMALCEPISKEQSTRKKYSRRNH